MLFGKPAGEIQQSDLQALIDSAVQEGDRVDFKRDMYGRADEDVREMLRDITAMANHQGGDIYIGIDEDDDAVAIDLTGVEGTGHVERIVSSCRANIQPHLNGLQVTAVPLETSRCVILIRVPLSLSGPHMVTHKGLNQFCKRHGRQKDKMSVDEIKAAFLSRFEGETRLESFLSQRKERLAKAIGEEPWLMLTATPLFLTEQIIDPRDERFRHLLYSPPCQPGSRDSIHCGWPSPTLRGLRADQESAGVRRYLEIHRNGHLEFATNYVVDSSPSGSGNLLASGVVVGYTGSFVRLFLALCQHAGVHTPSVFGLTVLNAKGLLLGVSAMRHSLQSREWDDAILDLPLIYVHDVATEFGAVTKNINDRLWNAFGYEECLVLDQAGNIPGC